MNWKLLFRLSLFALAIGIATVFWIPTKVEPVFWLLTAIVCTYLIAQKASSNYFLHGFCLSLLNAFWVASIHILFMESYMAKHPEEALMMEEMPLPDSPRLMMAMIGVFIGIAFGIVLGLFSFIAHKLMRFRIG